MRPLILSTVIFCAALVGVSPTHAQDQAALDAARARAASSVGRAESMLRSAAELADLVDMAREELGPNPPLDGALSRARAILPKPELGAGDWRALSGSSVGAQVSEPTLCRELASLCQAKAVNPAESGRCACGPDGRGAFEFVFAIPGP